MNLDELLAQAARRGVDLSALVVGREPDQVPSAPSHRWAAGLQHQATLPGSAVPVGTPLDHIGNESGHYLYLYNTPMSQRSVPPTDLDEERTGYLVAQPLPPDAAIERLPPWFGQPGGGLVARLPRVIRYYVDTQALYRFDTASLTP